MRKKPITQRTVDTTSYAPLLAQPLVKRCPICKQKFELLSMQWVYKTFRRGHMHYFCSYKCWRAEDKKENPTPVLRGEKVARKRAETGKDGKHE